MILQEWQSLYEKVAALILAARSRYMAEAANEGWSTRAMERQINSLYYERILSSRDVGPVKLEAAANTRELSPRDCQRRDRWTLFLADRVALIYTNFIGFRAKARQFLLAHEDHITIHKLRFNQPIRSLVGLDREAAKQAFGDFPGESIATANQVEFINLIINKLIPSLRY